LDSWSGRNYRLRYDHAQARDLLDTLPVHFIVIDDFGFRGSAAETHHELLKSIIRSDPDGFVLVNENSAVKGESVYPDAIKVYENVRARGRDSRDAVAFLKKLIRRQVSRGKAYRNQQRHTARP